MLSDARSDQNVIALLWFRITSSDRVSLSLNCALVQLSYGGPLFNICYTPYLLVFIYIGYLHQWNT
jgi:hypothetical protein